MEATLSAVSIGALIYGIIKSRQYMDSNNISTVMTPSFQNALAKYQQNPTNDNLKSLDNLKLQEQTELDKLKKKVQEDANRKLAQLLENAKAQAQFMYAKGKLQDAKNIEQMAQLKKTALLDDTQSNLEELAKRFQNTMTTVDTMIADAKVLTDKDLQKQIGAVTNELRTARNNEAILRQQVIQLQSQLQQKSSNANKQQIDELKSALESARRCSFEADMLKRELLILKSAKDGDKNAVKVSNQFIDLRRQLDEAKRNEQELLSQLNNERVLRNSGTNEVAKIKIQELENELTKLRRGAPSNAYKDGIIADLKQQLENARQRERQTTEQLYKVRNASSNTQNASRTKNELQYAKQHVYELQRQLESLERNANEKVTQMADEITKLKYALQQSKDEYMRIRSNANTSANNEVLYQAKQQINDLQRKLANLTLAGNARGDDMKYAFRIAELEKELQQAKMNKTLNNSSLQQQINALKQKSNSESNVILNLTNELEQARANANKAKRELMNARADGQDESAYKQELFQAQKKIEQLQNEIKKQETKLNTSSSAYTNESQSLIEQLQKELQQLRNESSKDTIRLSETIRELQNQLEKAKETKSELRQKNSNSNTNTNSNTNSNTYRNKLEQATNEIDRLKRELKLLQNASELTPNEKLIVKQLTDLQTEHLQSQEDLQNTLKQAQQHKQQLEQQHSQIQQYKNHITQLENKLSQLGKVNANTDPFTNRAVNIVSQYKQNAEQYKENAYNRALSIRGKTNTSIYNSPNDSNVAKLQRELLQSQKDIQQIQDEANQKVMKMTTRANELEQEISKLQENISYLQYQLKKPEIQHQQNGIDAKLNNILNTGLQDINSKMANKQVNDDCVKQIEKAVTDMREKLQNVETELIKCHERNDNLQQELSELQKANQQKDDALRSALESKKALEMEINKLKNDKNPNKLPQDIITTNTLIHKNLNNARDSISKNLDCAKKCCISKIDKEQLCSSLPGHNDKLPITDTQILEELNSYYKNVISSVSNVKEYEYSDAVKYVKEYATDTNQYTIVQSFKNNFFPLLNEHDDVKKLMAEIQDVVRYLLMAISNYMITQPIVDDTSLLDEFKIHDETNDKIKIIKLYIAIIDTILRSPNLYSFTSLHTDFVLKLFNSNDDSGEYEIANSEFQLFNDKNAPINRRIWIHALYNFLYLDITMLLQMRNNASFSSFYKEHFKQFEDFILGVDTCNCRSIRQFNEFYKPHSYLYLERFVNTLSNSFETEEVATTYSAQLFYDATMLHIARSIPFLIEFIRGIFKLIESEQNRTSFTLPIRKLLQKHIDENVLTYIKVRNDDKNNHWNQRFCVYVNEMLSPKSDITSNTALLVKYNDHNFKYYKTDFDNEQQNVKKSKDTSFPEPVERSIMMNQYNKIYKTPQYDQIFNNANNILSVREYKEEYLLGPYTKIFYKENNKTIAEQMTQVTKILTLDTPRPVFLIGYGASGAGKTSSLIYFNKGNDPLERNGVLVHVCNSLSAQFPIIHVKCYEFYNKLVDSDKLTFKLQERKYPELKFQYMENIENDTSKQFRLIQRYNHNNLFPSRVTKLENTSDLQQKKVFEKGSPLGEVLIHMIDKDRFVKATTNNPNSSRSHSLVFITFVGTNGIVNKKRTLIIGDFAGVENEFDCQNELQLLGFLRAESDNEKDKLFYSNVDQSLYGAEGGRRKKTPSSKHKLQTKQHSGGKYSRDCDFVMHDVTRNFFKIYKSDRLPPQNIPTLQSNITAVFQNPPEHLTSAVYALQEKKQNLDQILTSMFSDKTIDNEKRIFQYGKFLESIYVNILKHSNIETNNPLDRLVSFSREEIIELFKNYINQPQNNKQIEEIKGINKFIHDTNVFVSLIKGIDDDINKKFPNKKLNITNSDKANAALINFRDNVMKNVIVSTTNNKEQNLSNFCIFGQGLESINSLIPCVNVTYNKKNNVITDLNTLRTGTAATGNNNQKCIDIIGNFRLNSVAALLKKIGDEVEKVKNYIETDCLSMIKDRNDKPKFLSARLQLVNTSALSRYIVNKPHDDTNKTPRTEVITVTKEDIYTGFVKFFNNPFFALLNMRMNESNKYFMFDELLLNYFIENTHVNHVRTKILKYLLPLSPQPVSTSELCLALVKEALEVVLILKCRKEYYAHICTTRKNEGYFINDSLKEIREIIKDIMFEKNKESINIAPLFHRPCLPAYCNNNKCFRLDKAESSLSRNVIFNAIVEELEGDIVLTQVKNREKRHAQVLRDIVIGVFTVVNISSNVNNPPPVPYIDTNSLRVALGKTKKITTEIVEECKRLWNRLTALTNPHAEVKLDIHESHIMTLGDIILNGKFYEKNPPSLSLQIRNHLNKALEYFENISAASLIGTLQYTDALSKYNTTNAICSQYTFKQKNNDLYRTLLASLGLKNIVKPEDTYCYIPYPKQNSNHNAKMGNLECKFQSKPPLEEDPHEHPGMIFKKN
jgi:chromosome segregation ATPase